MFAMIEVKNLQEVFNDIDRWLESVERQIDGVAKGLGTEALMTLLDHSPQYSGDFAANWKVSVNAPDVTFVADVFPEKKFPAKDGIPFSNGDNPAIAYAIGEATGKMDSFKLGDTIWISNSAEHKELYAWKIENNKITFRPGNYGETVRMTVDEMIMRYTDISKEDANGLIVGAR